jgi:protein-disulfide isomerase
VDRRTLNIAIALSPLALAGGLVPGIAEAQSGVDLKAALAPRYLGSPDAKVTVVEFFSLTCSHCAAFHMEVLPAIKAKYIKTGLVRLEYRDFPLDQYALRAAAMTRCASPKSYPVLVDVLFKQQSRWAHSDDPAAALTKIGRLAGMSAKKIEACMSNEVLMDGILKARLIASKDLEISSTPSFMIDGEKLPSGMSLEQFDELLAKALG